MDKQEFLGWVETQPCRWQVTNEWAEFATHVVGEAGACTKCGLTLGAVHDALQDAKVPLMVYENVFHSRALREQLLESAKSCLDSATARTRTEEATSSYEAFRAQRAEAEGATA